MITKPAAASPRGSCIPGLTIPPMRASIYCRQISHAQGSEGGYLSANARSRLTAARDIVLRNSLHPLGDRRKGAIALARPLDDPVLL